MKLQIPLVFLFSFFLLTIVSAYVPLDPMVIDPIIAPAPLFLPCNCNDGYDISEACTVGSCEGTRECQSSSICIEQSSGDCEDPMCGLPYGACSFDCSSDYDLCIVPCSLPWASSDCTSNCQDTRDACYDDCEDTRDECNACDGMWSSCEVDACCGVNCDDNRLCNSGVCECADTEERCAADGTGDGVDNDCDGAIDEACTECIDGLARPCQDSNNCTGTQECLSGAWESCQKNNPCCGISCGTNKVCEGSTGNCICKDTEERCKPIGIGDNIDNDCDGEVDEGCMTDQELEALINQSGGVPPQPPTGGAPPIVGNDSDEHGCIGSAGYVWCDSLNICIRPWETECPVTADTTPQPDSLTTKPPKTTSSELDLNLIIVLLIVIIAGIFVLLSIKMMKGKKSAQPATTQPAQPVQQAQPPQ